MALNGIDVASYQNGIGKVAGDFRIVKVTEGTNYVNPAWQSQVKTAPSLLGLYHFASNTNAKSEAKYFVSKVKSYIGKAILVLDYEPKNPNPSWAKTFLDEVYNMTGVRPIIYLGLSVENNYDWSAVAKANYGVWMAQYNNYNAVNGFKPRDLYGKIKHWKSMVMFQYTSAGRLSGWNGNLDFDVFYGDKKAWQAYAKTTKKGAADSGSSKPKSKPNKPSSNIPKGFTKENGTFVNGNQDIQVRYGASLKSAKAGMLKPKQSIKYDSYINQDGYVWVHYIGYNGKDLYLPTHPTGTPNNVWGTFK